MKLSFYRVDADYCNFLRIHDPCVPYTMDAKLMRPFVGIILFINGFCYYAPLTSPKLKHLHMKNQIDFLKINGGVWGAVNLNNMIPVHPQSLAKIEMKPLSTDSKDDINYKNLLANQLSWCETNKDTISTRAKKLYMVISQGKGFPALASRCCNFPVDEARLAVYCQIHSLSSPSDS